MSGESKAIFVKATPYDESSEKGRFSRFGPGTRTLPKGWRYDDFQPLPVDVVFEKDVAVRLRDGVTIYVDVFRRPARPRCRSSSRGVPTARAAAASRRSRRSANASASTRANSPA